MLCIGSDSCKRSHDDAVLQEDVANLDGLEQFGGRHGFQVGVICDWERRENIRFMEEIS